MKTNLMSLVLLVAVCVFALSPSASRATPAGANVSIENSPTSQDESVKSERDAIRLVLQQYLDVMDKQDYESLKKAFHPEAKLLSVGKNGLNQLSLDDWWKRISNPPPNAPSLHRKSKVSLIDVTEIAAVARIDVEQPQGSRIGNSSDYLSLLKINNEWKIVNKVLSHKLNI